ncbi:MAG: hypothetical protein KGJ70_14175 [Gemmatimonadota bacterium]|nr:hypothetical protein [Gemmatimonadota bacterium]
MLVALCVPLIAINVAGAPFYTASLAVRARHPWRAWLQPSGYIGQSAGIAAFLIFVFLWLYPLRKKWKALRWTGSIGRWLDVHVTTALLLPLLLAIHAAWRADGLIGLGLASMYVVIASGIVGRYLYTRIPRTRNGIELTRDEVGAQRRELIQELAAATGLTPDALETTLHGGERARDDGNPLRVLAQLVAADLFRWRRTRQLRARWAALTPGHRVLNERQLREAVRLADRELALEQQSRMLDATHRVFRYWHVAHRPFALTALVAVVIHVAVVIAVGATWFR